MTYDPKKDQGNKSAGSTDPSRKGSEHPQTNKPSQQYGNKDKTGNQTPEDRRKGAQQPSQDKFSNPSRENSSNLSKEDLNKRGKQ